MARSWYAYVSSGLSVELPGSYSLVTGIPGCTDGSQLCAVYANSGGNFPSSISQNLQRYISDGLVKLTAQPDSPTNSKYFVVFKS